jgi:hypothetical protein
MFTAADEDGVPVGAGWESLLVIVSAGLPRSGW